MTREYGRSPESKIAAHWLTDHTAHISHLEQVEPERIMREPTSVPQIFVPPTDVMNIRPHRGDFIDGSPLMLDPKSMPEDLHELTPVGPTYRVGRSSIGIQPHLGDDDQFYTMLMRMRQGANPNMYPFVFEENGLSKKELKQLLHELGIFGESEHEALRFGFAQSLLIIAEQHSQAAQMFAFINQMYMDPTITRAKMSMPVGVNLSIQSPDGYIVNVSGTSGQLSMEFQRDAPVIIQAHGQLVNVRTAIPGKGLFKQGGVNSHEIGVTLERAMALIAEAKARGGDGWIE